MVDHATGRTYAPARPVAPRIAVPAPAPVPPASIPPASIPPATVPPPPPATPPSAWRAPTPTRARDPLDTLDPRGSTPDFDRPSAARVQDHLLGGAAHGAVDRAFAAALLAREPRLTEMTRTHRLFVRRVVRYLLAAGIEQFVDLGSGMPTMGNVHEVVRRLRPDATVAYVDDDPVAVANGRRVLADVSGVAYLDADVRDVDAVLDDPALRAVVDLSRPVGLLAFSVLQHLPDAADPAGLVDAYLARLPRGSALGLSHPTADDPRLSMDLVGGLLEAHPGTWIRPRSRPDVIRMMRGVALVEPGVTWAGLWRPEPGRPNQGDAACGHWAGVGFRP